MIWTTGSIKWKREYTPTHTHTHTCPPKTRCQMLHGMETNHMAMARAAPSGPITSQKRKQPMRIIRSGYFCFDTHGLRRRHNVRCTRLSGAGRTSCSTTRFHCCTIWVRVKWNWRGKGRDARSGSRRSSRRQLSERKSRMQAQQHTGKGGYLPYARDGKKKKP